MIMLNMSLGMQALIRILTKMARHAERYPTIRHAERIIKLQDRMKNFGIVFKGDLSFFNEWELFLSDDSQIGQLTTTGPFSGSLGSVATGVRLRTRYQPLLAKAMSRRGKVKYWASDSQRVIDTARYFGTGFFGIGWQNVSNLEVISESPELGGDTLTPGDTCIAYGEDDEEGHGQGARLTEMYRATYLADTRKRLLKQNPEIEFSDEELYTMQEMCGFETMIRGSSHWCDVFTRDEFISFEYARDLLHYYRSGPGTKYGAVMGWLWLNATTNLLLEGPDAGHFFFSFVHDGDIVPMLTALDIINDAEHLPITHIPRTRRWRKSQVSPMGGRIIFELLSCKSDDAQSKQSREQYIRININDGITAIPECNSGPGKSCPLADFAARTKRKGEEAGDFREKCALSEDAADRITFLHQRGI
ncbi:phosphoglycerate mutase-like protein [Lojkania enalia]|uniref:Phosphoglycerate mutase-like protein n=1 Tax=Lojkania enalia TaxID=147567 RepID=A0A9P4K824_9PLEO|nr:phosphoglycerate mutase-like protein [Didymosphaeria enalia]